MKILLFGDNFGIPKLTKFIDKNNICGIVAASIRPQYFEELRQIALNLGRPFLIQPKKVDNNYHSFIQTLLEIKPDLIWVNSYSMILQPEILDIPRSGCVNNHGALLPQYRGCNPSQWAILNGENKVGVTLHEMLPGIDEGDIIDQRDVELFFNDTWKSLLIRIGKENEKIISTNLAKIISGNWNSKKQDPKKANYYRRRTPEDGHFHWAMPVYHIYNLVRALVSPLPGAFYVNGINEKVFVKQYLTPAEIINLKYGSTGKQKLEKDNIRLNTIQQNHIQLISNWITCDELFVLNEPLKLILEKSYENWSGSNHEKRMDLIIFLIQNIEHSLPIGIGILFNINWYHKSAELEIKIDKNQTGQKDNFTNASKLLVGFGFDELNLQRIFSCSIENNMEKLILLKKCGFKAEGKLRNAALVNDCLKDKIILSILRDEYV